MRLRRRKRESGPTARREYYSWRQPEDKAQRGAHFLKANRNRGLGRGKGRVIW